eukprot:TRINITY_DN2674_c0_g1_i1.p1 TRINITY_DN2674_c0_g1~~TRINITY_DN2674_c0_g1_i1.p1  ORF type:complete len:180 (+),score=54.20 TRINITY_DN2674_c0_g1_i1:430-969(+)
MTDNGKIELNFPGDPSTEIKDGVPESLLNSLDLTEDDILYYGYGRLDVILLLKNPDLVLKNNPNYSELSNYLTAVDKRCCIITSIPTNENDQFSDLDCVSRVFAPNDGINEDPVTGSAHCLIGSFIRERLSIDDRPIQAYQASERGGYLELEEFINEKEEKRIYLRGSAVTVMIGTMFY